MSTISLPRLLSAEEVSKATGIPLQRVYELAREGLMPAVHIGRAVRFSESALLEWIERGGTQSQNERVSQ